MGRRPAGPPTTGPAGRPESERGRRAPAPQDARTTRTPAAGRPGPDPMRRPTGRGGPSGGTTRMSPIAWWHSRGNVLGLLRSWVGHRGICPDSARSSKDPTMTHNQSALSALVQEMDATRTGRRAADARRALRGRAVGPARSGPPVGSSTTRTSSSWGPRAVDLPDRAPWPAGLACGPARVVDLRSARCRRWRSRLQARAQWTSSRQPAAGTRGAAGSSHGRRGDVDLQSAAGGGHERRCRIFSRPAWRCGPPVGSRRRARGLRAQWASWQSPSG